MLFAQQLVDKQIYQGDEEDTGYDFAEEGGHGYSKLHPAVDFQVLREGLKNNQGDDQVKIRKEKGGMGLVIGDDGLLEEDVGNTEQQEGDARNKGGKGVEVSKFGPIFPKYIVAQEDMGQTHSGQGIEHKAEVLK